MSPNEKNDWDLDDPGKPENRRPEGHVHVYNGLAYLFLTLAFVLGFLAGRITS